MIATNFMALTKIMWLARGHSLDNGTHPQIRQMAITPPNIENRIESRVISDTDVMQSSKERSENHLSNLKGKRCVERENDSAHTTGQVGHFAGSG